MISWAPDLAIGPLIGVGGGADWSLAPAPEDVFRRRVLLGVSGRRQMDPLDPR